MILFLKRKWADYIKHKYRNAPLKTYILDVPYRFTMKVEARTKYDAQDMLWPTLQKYTHEYACYMLDTYLEEQKD